MKTRKFAWLGLLALAALTGCPKRPAGPAPDYESTRQHSKEAHQGLDQEKGPGGQ